MSKPMCHVSYIGAMSHTSKWVPCGKMQPVTNIVARLFMYTLYNGHIRIQ
jgi:hypothetical protein